MALLRRSARADSSRLRSLVPLSSSARLPSRELRASYHVLFTHLLFSLHVRRSSAPFMDYLYAPASIMDDYPPKDLLCVPFILYTLDTYNTSTTQLSRIYPPHSLAPLVPTIEMH